MAEHDKSDYLSEKVRPFNPSDVKSVQDLLDQLKYCGFQGRNLGNALNILYKMVTEDEILTILALSGAMVPAGMGELVSILMENHLIDALVTTGANTIHDLVDSVSNVGHFIGSSNVDDDDLFEHRINRIYDVFLPEDKYKLAEDELLRIIHEIFEEKEISITPSKLLKRIGSKVKNRCILSVAAKNNIPIFVPAFSDSEFALNLIKYSVREGYKFNIDIFGDVMKFAEIIQSSLSRMGEISKKCILEEVHDSIILSATKATLNKAIDTLVPIMNKPFEDIDIRFPVKVSIGKKWKHWKQHKVFR